MSEPQPFTTMTKAWCPECGRDDRYTYLRHSLPHRRPDGKACTGKPIILHFRLVGRSDGKEVPS